MEEDIKNDLAGIAFSHPFFSSIVDGVLNYIQELEEENKRLNNHNLIGRIDAIKIEDLEPVLKPYYIPISVIQNKIDKLEEKRKHISEGSLDYQLRQYNYIGCKIDVLQELLDERNKNYGA